MTTETVSSTQKASSLHSLVGWLNRRSQGKLREKIVALEAELEYWSGLATPKGTLPEHRCGWIGRKKGELAALRERFARREPPNDQAHRLDEAKPRNQS